MHREKWYGLLFSQTSASKKANLVLCVLYPNSDVPWLGQTVYLEPKKTADIADPRMQPGSGAAAAGGEGKSFPVGPSHPPSFHTPSNLLWAKETVLQVGVLGWVCPLPDEVISFGF